MQKLYLYVRDQLYISMVFRQPTMGNQITLINSIVVMQIISKSIQMNMIGTLTRILRNDDC